MLRIIMTIFTKYKGMQGLYLYDLLTIKLGKLPFCIVISSYFDKSNLPLIFEYVYN